MTDTNARLANRDYTLIIDKSGSMQVSDVPGYRSRWHAVQESTRAIASKLHQLAPEGFTLYLFGSNFKRYEKVTPDAVDRIFSENEPMGGTNLHLVLRDVFDKWRSRKKNGQLKNGEIVVVVTDGVPNDENLVANEIKNVTKSMDKDEELGLTFFQVGNDNGASRYLKRLDDDLQHEGAKFDVVDTKTFDELENTTITEALLAALDD